MDYESDIPLPGELSPKVEPQPGDNTSSAFSAVATAPTSTPVGSPTLSADRPPGKSQTASLYETNRADDELCLIEPAKTYVSCAVMMRRAPWFFLKVPLKGC